MKMMWRSIVGGLLGLLLVLSGCGGGGEGGAGGDATSLAAKHLAASEGGTVAIEPPHQLAGTAITVPPGALAIDTLISVDSATLATQPGLVGFVVDIGPDGTRFTPPARVTLGYDPAELPIGVAPSQLTIVEDRELPERTPVKIPTYRERAEKQKEKRRAASIFGQPKPVPSA